MVRRNTTFTLQLVTSILIQEILRVYFATDVHKSLYHMTPFNQSQLFCHITKENYWQLRAHPRRLHAFFF